jgi:hypothetical protein
MNDDVKPWPADNDHEGNVAFAPTDDAPPSGPLDEIKSGLKIWADVGLTLGKNIDEQAKTWRQLMARLQHNTPVDYGLGQAGVYPATGDLLLNFGSPDLGFRWEVSSVVVGGADVNIAAAGSAGLYVSASPPVAGQPAPGGLTNLADRASALPNVGFYGTRQLVVNDQEYLFLIIFGGTPGQTYAANFSATVFPSDAGGGRDVVTL